MNRSLSAAFGLAALFTPSSFAQVGTPTPAFDLTTQFQEYPTPAGGVHAPGGPALVDLTGLCGQGCSRPGFKGADASVIYDPSLPGGFEYEMWFTNQVTDPADGSPHLGIAWAFGDAAAGGQDYSVFRSTNNPVQIQPALLPSKAPSAGAYTAGSNPQSYDWDGVETASVLTLVPGEYYLMFFAGRKRLCYNQNNSRWAYGYQIGVAIGTPGGIFQRLGPGPIIPAGAPGEWDSFSPTGYCVTSGPVEPTVIVDPEDPTRLLMWYAAFDHTRGEYRIGRAHCPDISQPTVWVKDGPVFDPVPSSTWESASVSHVNVIADPNIGFHMFYHGHTSNGGAGGDIGHAYSSDGFNWNRRATPILESDPHSPEHDRFGGPTAFLRNGRIELVFMKGNPTGGFTGARQYRAHSL